MITKPSLAIPPWGDSATSADLIQPDPAYIASGFPKSNDKPSRQTMNWILGYCSNGVQYMVARGLPDWDAAQTYTAGDVVRFAGKFYSALQSNNTNRSPATQTSWWAMWLVFAADLNALYLTPAQGDARYISVSSASNPTSGFITVPTLNSATKVLQDQINAITAVTGTGYTAGAGIAIDPGNIIRNTAVNTQADWNATVGGAAAGVILNRPTLATVATSGLYSDLTGRPTIPAAQVNSDWNATSGVAQILNKPTTLGGALYVLTSPVTANQNTTAKQNLASYTIPAGTLNALGKVLRATLGGKFTNNANDTSQFTLSVTFGTVPVFTVNFGYVAYGLPNLPWRSQFEFVVTTTGLSGHIVPHGTLVWGYQVGENWGNAMISADSPGPINLTLAGNLAVQCQWEINSSPASICVQDMFIVEVLN